MFEKNTGYTHPDPNMYVGLIHKNKNSWYYWFCRRRERKFVQINKYKVPISSDTQLSSGNEDKPSVVLVQGLSNPVEAAVDNGNALPSSIGMEGIEDE